MSWPPDPGTGGGFTEWPQSPDVVHGGGNNQGDGYRNPTGVTPLPTPDLTKRPTGYYEAEPLALSFVRGEGQVLYRATWTSALLNLRTDLRGASSREPGGYPVNRLYAIQLWIAITGLASGCAGLEVYAADYGHPTNAQRDRAIQFTPWVNVTAELQSQTNLSILDYFPPGSGYQMWYWGKMLRFDFLTRSPVAGGGRLPLITVTAGAY